MGNRRFLLGKISRYHFLQPPGRTQTLGSSIRERSKSPLEGTPSSVPGTELPSKKWKTSDKENLPYFRIWKTCPSFRSTHEEPTQKSPNILALEGGDLQGQITDIHRARETTRENPDLSSEVQNLKEKLEEHSKQLEQSTDKLTQLQSENTVLRDQNQSLNATGNKKCRFNTRIRPMENLNTPNSGERTIDTPPTSGVAGATREGTENPQIHYLEESDSEPEPEKEAPERAGATESSITAYLEQIFSKRFDAMQSMRRTRTPRSEVNDTGNWGSFRRRRILSHSKNPSDPQRIYVDRSARSPPKSFKVASAHKTWSSQDLRPLPNIDKITENFIRYQPVVSRINNRARVLQGDLQRGYIGRIWSKRRLANAGWRYLARQEASEPGRSGG
ncbi:hypothetical protein F2Q69_00036221 [Brassica cretica]|uniref:Uncharacterized protein n=1 Tax=Brassica cretica TaxID=69181 RepID=A0A8S9SGS7_BRACR|nr:hypothetical protein F2Q69_00036221 [Brassica cretica]